MEAHTLAFHRARKCKRLKKIFSEERVFSPVWDEAAAVIKENGGICRVTI